MEFKNLDFNILYVLGEDCCRAGTSGPFDLKYTLESAADKQRGIQLGLMKQKPRAYL